MCGCGSVGPLDGYNVGAAPLKEPALDPRYLNVKVPANVNWTEKAESAGLKAVQLGQEHLGVGVPPDKFFKVIYNGEVIFYDKKAALEVATKIFAPDAVGVQAGAVGDENKQINDLCNILIAPPAEGRAKDIADATARLKQNCERFDKDMASQSKDRNPGIALFLASEAFRKRQQLIGEMQAAKAPVSETRMLELSSKSFVPKLDQRLAKLSKFLDAKQLVMLNDVMQGKVKTHNTVLGFKTSQRTDAEIAQELRPIVTTVLARALITLLPAHVAEAKAMIDKLSTYDKGGVWLEMFRPNGHLDLDLHSMMQAWTKLPQ